MMCGPLCVVTRSPEWYASVFPSELPWHCQTFPPRWALDLSFGVVCQCFPYLPKMLREEMNSAQPSSSIRALLLGAGASAASAALSLCLQDLL